MSFSATISRGALRAFSDCISVIVVWMILARHEQDYYQVLAVALRGNCHKALKGIIRALLGHCIGFFRLYPLNYINIDSKELEKGSTRQNRLLQLLFLRFSGVYRVFSSYGAPSLMP